MGRIVSPDRTPAGEAHRDMVVAVSWQVSAASAADAAEIAQVAARCFPLACSPATAPADVAGFIAANLTVEKFTDFIDDPTHHVLLVRSARAIAGYAMLISGRDEEPVELSKMYVLPEFHGGGAATALMEHALDHARGCGADTVWLGVNRANQRAQRFYRKHGFEVTGTRSFQVGENLEADFIMQKRL
jgi:ribosomal protein S18 acetylase RimI-like enzyme